MPTARPPLPKADNVFVYRSMDEANEPVHEMRDDRRNYARVRVVRRTVRAFGESCEVVVVAVWYTEAGKSTLGVL